MFLLCIGRWYEFPAVSIFWLPTFPWLLINSLITAESICTTCRILQHQNYPRGISELILIDFLCWRNHSIFQHSPSNDNAADIFLIFCPGTLLWLLLLRLLALQLLLLGKRCCYSCRLIVTAMADLMPFSL